MFKRLFFLSGIIAFLLASGFMYFWYLPNHPTENPMGDEVEIESNVISAKSDSLEVMVPGE